MRIFEAMESLVPYEDSDPEDKEAGECLHHAGTAENEDPCDYFGLEDSSEDEAVQKRFGKTLPTKPKVNKLMLHKELNKLDVLIDAYSLSNETYGPVRKEVNASYVNSNATEVPVKKKRFKKVENITSESKQWKEKDDIKSEDDLFIKPEYLVTHPKIQKCVQSFFHSQPPRTKMKDLNGHCSCVNDLQWCNSALSHLLLSVSMDKTIRIWDIFQKKCVLSLTNHIAGVKTAKWDLSNNTILSCSYDKTAKITDVTKGQIISIYPHESFVTSACWHPVDNNLFLSGSQNLISLWDKRTSTQKAEKMYSGNFNQVQDIIFEKSGEQFFCCTDLVSRDSDDRAIMAWDLKSNALLSNQIYRDIFNCTCLQLHPDGECFVAQSNGNYIVEFSTKRPYKMNKKKHFGNHKVSGYNVQCSFTPDGKYLYSGSADGKLYCYDFENSNFLKSFDIFPSCASIAVACHPVLNSAIAVGSWKGEIEIWH